MRHRRGQSGFLMVEAIVMTVVLAIGLLGILQAVLVSIEAAQVTRETAVAEQLARMKMTEIELSPDAFLGSQAGAVTVGPRTYSWASEVAQTKDSALLSVRVNVNYWVREKARAIHLETLALSGGGGG